MIKTNKQIWQRDREESRAFDTHNLLQIYFTYLYDTQKKKEQREETLLRMIYF